MIEGTLIQKRQVSLSLTKSLITQTTDPNKRSNSSQKLRRSIKHGNTLLVKRKYTELNSENEPETINPDPYKMLTSSHYFADSSTCSGVNKESTNKEEVESKVSFNDENLKSVRKKSIDSYGHLIVKQNNHSEYYNYEEIFDKFAEEEKDMAELDVKSVKSEKLKKLRKVKNGEIYISDQEDKNYDPYKVQENYIQKMNREMMHSEFHKYLEQEQEKKKAKAEENNKKKPCCEACCLIC